MAKGGAESGRVAYVQPRALVCSPGMLVPSPEAFVCTPGFTLVHSPGVTCVEARGAVYKPGVLYACLTTGI